MFKRFFSTYVYIIASLSAVVSICYIFMPGSFAKMADWWWIPFFVMPAAVAFVRELYLYITSREEGSELNWRDLSILAQLVLNEEVIPERYRTWSRIRWKTLYTIGLKQAFGHGTDKSLIGIIRHYGDWLAKQLSEGDQRVADWYKSQIGPDGTPFGGYPFYKELVGSDNISENEVEHIFNKVRQAKRSNEAEIPELTADRLAQVFYWEAMLYAIFHFRAESGTEQFTQTITQIFGQYLEALYPIVCELLTVNALRDMDACLRLSDRSSVPLQRQNLLEYLTCHSSRPPAELYYLTRWQDELSIVMINDDASSAEFGLGGPYPDDQRKKLDVSYRVFAQKAPEKGFKFLIANYQDIPKGDIIGADFAAWDLVGNDWKSQRHWRTEFFFDKFPSRHDTIELREATQQEARVRIWNKVSFTTFIADKWEVYNLLCQDNVPTLSPAFKVNVSELTLTRQRQDMIETIQRKASELGYRFGNDVPCIVIKPLSAYGGKGALRVTPEDFLTIDLSKDEIYEEYNGAIIQPFYESFGFCSIAKVRGRHDIRIVVVGTNPIFGMIRELDFEAPETVWIASLATIESDRGSRRYLSQDQLLRIPEISNIVNSVNEAIYKKFQATPSIFSIDMMYIGAKDVCVVELNSKPSQVWSLGDKEGEKYIQQFQDAILDEFGKLYEEYDLSTTLGR